MKIGDYCRTKSGWICKLDYYDEKEKRWITHDENDWYPVYETQIKISSPNIIDLIEVGDYVNGDRVTEITNEYIEVCYGRDTFDFIDKKDIKSIVTKEQFEDIKYEVN